MNTNSKWNLKVVVAAAIIAVVIGLYIPIEESPAKSSEVTIITNVIGKIEAVNGKYFAKRDTHEGNAELRVFLDVLASGTCRVLVRVDDQLKTYEPRYSFCQKAEPGETVKLKKTTIQTIEGQIVRVSYRLLPTV